MIGDAALLACLAERWGLEDVRVEPHHGGMNSSTWFVTRPDARWVAKAVAPEAARSFRGGLAVASALAGAGIAAGAPVSTSDGHVVTFADGVPLALLAWVPGDPLTRADQRLVAATLARVHRVLVSVQVDASLVDMFHWVDPSAEHLGIHPWVRDRVSSAVSAFDVLDPGSLTWGMLHADPAPEAFRYDGDECGLIDWSVALHGPLLYDLASAVMYVGGPSSATELLSTYLEQGVLSESEVSRGLAVMLRFRWAVQADYFARRLANGDLTGIADSEENEQGLEDARRALVGGW